MCFCFRLISLHGNTSFDAGVGKFRGKVTRHEVATDHLHAVVYPSVSFGTVFPKMLMCIKPHALKKIKNLQCLRMPA
jgi:hypothetical protein